MVLLRLLGIGDDGLPNLSFVMGGDFNLAPNFKVEACLHAVHDRPASDDWEYVNSDEAMSGDVMIYSGGFGHQISIHGVEYSCPGNRGCRNAEPDSVGLCLEVHLMMPAVRKAADWMKLIRLCLVPFFNFQLVFMNRAVLEFLQQLQVVLPSARIKMLRRSMLKCMLQMLTLPPVFCQPSGPAMLMETTMRFS